MKKIILLVLLATSLSNAFARGIDCNAHNVYTISEGQNVLAEAKESAVIRLREPKELKSLSFDIPDVTAFTIADDSKYGSQTETIISTFLGIVREERKAFLELRAPGRMSFRQWNEAKVQTYFLQPTLFDQTSFNNVFAKTIWGGRVQSKATASGVTHYVRLDKDPFGLYIKIENRLSFECARSEAE
jgi:hypothetical protein